MKKAILTIALFSIVSFLYSQTEWKPSKTNHQIGVSFGMANYLGDIANKAKEPLIGLINSKAFKGAVNLNYRNNFTYYSSFKAEIMYLRVFGNDSDISDPFRVNRNLSFRTDIIDLNLMLEWNIMKYEIGSLKRNFTPYIGFGLAGFYYNPQAELEGKWINLRELGIEGQGILKNREIYSQFEFGLPVSAGVKYNITKFLAVGFDFQFRVTFTDHLDDVSAKFYVPEDLFNSNYSKEEADLRNKLAYRAIDKDMSPRETDIRGNPDNNDHYFLFLLNLSYKFSSNKRYFPKYR